jgi:hypothetical protein
MSDFGANIFDDAPGKALPAPAAPSHREPHARPSPQVDPVAPLDRAAAQGSRSARADGERRDGRFSKAGPNPASSNPARSNPASPNPASPNPASNEDLHRPANCGATRDGGELGPNAQHERFHRSRPESPTATAPYGARGRAAPSEPAGRLQPEPRHRAPDHRAPRQHQDAPPARQGAVRSRPDEDLPNTAAVAALVDLDALRAEARALRAELALQRLRPGLAGGRIVARAVGFSRAAGPAPQGFEHRRTADTLDGGIQLAALALELLRLGSPLILAPATPAFCELAASLRAAGHRVELAGFPGADAPLAPGTTIRKLGRDCLFVP